MTWTMLVAALLFSASLAAANHQGDYTSSIEDWRREHQKRLTTDNGWLTVTGLFFLREGDNSFGSDPLNDIVIPEGPEHAGVFNLHDRQVTIITPVDQMLIVNGEQVSHARLYPREQPTTVTIGALTLMVHTSGERLAIRMRDKNSDLWQNFSGLRWYPVNGTYRVPARFIPHDEPISVKIQNILGDIETYTSHGSAALSIKGQELRMLSLTAGNRLWFIFRDLTSGTETYPAARFLYSDAPEDGSLIIDFNMAYNPPCAFSPYTTCPLPPQDNRLPVRVEAGELNYMGPVPTSIDIN